MLKRNVYLVDWINKTDKEITVAPTASNIYILSICFIHLNKEYRRSLTKIGNIYKFLISSDMIVDSRANMNNCV